MKTRLLTLIALSLTAAATPAFARHDAEGPQFPRRWLVAQADADTEAQKKWADGQARALSSETTEDQKDKEASAEPKEEEMGKRRPVPHHMGMGER